MQSLMKCFNWLPRCAVQKATTQSSRSVSDSLYAQPMKVKLPASHDITSAQSQSAGSSFERGMQVLSPGVNGQDAQPSPSAYRRQVPQPTELGSSRAVVTDGMVGRAGRAGALYGQLDEHGLPLVPKGDCGDCGQPITGQVVLLYFICLE